MAKLTLPMVSLCARKVELAKRTDRRLDRPWQDDVGLQCDVSLSVTRW